MKFGPEGLHFHVYDTIETELSKIQNGGQNLKCPTKFETGPK